MRKSKWIIFCFFCFIINGTFAQLPQGEIAGSEIINISSAINNQNYILYVKLPSSYKDNPKKTYPVVYILDAQWGFISTLEIARGLIYDNLLNEVIFVGIAFPHNYIVNRTRDFTPTHADTDSGSGGASKFLEVIGKEIMKKIDVTYRTDKTNNGLVGNSFGGLFVLYTLFTQPSLFNGYVAKSPSLWYDNGLMQKMEKKFSENNHVLHAKLFMSNGSYEEELDSAPLFKIFYEQLKASNYRGLELERLIVEKAGHGSASFYGICRGFQFAFGKPDIMVDTVLLNQYIGHYEQGLSFIRIGDFLFIDLGAKKIKLFAESELSFYTRGENGITEFVKDGTGKVIGVKFNSAEENYFSKRID